MASNTKSAAYLLAISGALTAFPTIAAEQAAESGQMEEVVVQAKRTSQADLAIGEDKVSNTVGVTRDELLSAPAGISGLKMLESLPGFNVQTDGALGLYEFGNSVQVRAFSLAQVGFVLDGVPMGRSDAFGGSPIFRYVDNENLGSVLASPGAGDVSMPSYTSLGPIVSYNSIEPSDQAGAFVSLTSGDDNLLRSFVRLETGDINGFSAYVSRSKTDSDLWRGPGTIDREHIESKARYEFDEDTYVQASFISNDFYDYDSPSGTESTFDADYYYAYLSELPAGCNNPMPGVYDFNGDGSIDDQDFTPVNTGSNCTLYYEDRVNIRDDKLYTVSLATDLTADVYLNSTLYFEDKDGYGVSPDSYGNSLSIYERQAAAGLDVVHPRGVQFGYSGVGGERQGLVTGIEWQLGDHKLQFGGWFEDETYNRSQLRYNKTDGSADGKVIWDEVAYYRRNYTSTRETMQFYVKDSIALMDERLNVEVGAKSLTVDYALEGYRDYADYEIGGMPGYGPQSVGAKYSDNFMPMVGAVYNLNDTDQVFGSISENFALPKGADDIFSIATSFEAPAPKGETAENIEIGYRTSRPHYNGAVSMYYTSFDNRLVAGNVLNPATGEPEAFYTNVGETTAWGVELSGVYMPAVFKDSVYFNANVSYNSAELSDGFGNNPAGSKLADSPEWLLTGGVTWEPTDWAVANFSLKYTGKRYADYAEMFEMDDYTVASAYVDFSGEAIGLNNANLRLNLDNVFDTQVMSFVYAGSPYYRPLSPRTFQGTVTYSF
ncbi:TonB-dependent receptor [Microbulbifer bruguierae]|uniref:TonB-dependent receptor n=1 Tax=Microbulbifer bruguierae TaxID=3029061 RepID=A0ABY8N8J6_9GAMM|nr:TonB-dependent receptor [Microbulbifer bruguierae]WGL15218.1 TonB-dependent receptor [Microbulbifer bruguierae]